MTKTIKSDDEKCKTSTSETQESSGTEMESIFSEITARRNEALYNYTRNRMLNAHRFKNFNHRDYSMTSSSSSSSSSDDYVDNDKAVSIKDVTDAAEMKFEEAISSLTSEDDQTVYTASQIVLKSATDTMSENNFDKKTTRSPGSSLILDKQCTCRCAIHNPNGHCYIDIKGVNSKTANIRTSISINNNNKVQMNTQKNIQKNVPKNTPKPPEQNVKNDEPTKVIRQSASNEAVKSSDSVSDIDKDLREKLMNFKLVLINHRQQEIMNEKLKKMEDYRLRNAAAQVKTPRRVTFAEPESSESSEVSTTDDSVTSMDTDEENYIQNPMESIRDYENELPYRISHTLPLRELAPDVPHLKNFNNAKMPVPKMRNIRHPRKNASFSNKELREIERTNKILLQKIVSQKPTFTTSGQSSKASVRFASTASINRRKQQRQIDLDNQILKRKIEAIAVRKPVILK
ncbi:ring-infected erythrocyte surface antigen-like [Teleopsis dalmanni]|uniref:ring-infected erythrocyte surface antigen-like n=1 Tax=Teleopsis dalmanni TaxID=139649 RepID=UPI0018CFE26A|nr:ring-infected erythrocyte surface antigen-like [Teleopsis dalmanni]